MNRRSFLVAVAAAAGAGVHALGAEDGPYRIGVETYCFHDVDLGETIARSRELGLRYMELHDGHLPRDSSPETLARARAALAKAGISATGVYIHDAFTESEAAARPIFEYARTMGFGYINGGPARESLPLLDRLVPEYGIQIAIHNHGPGARYETLEDVTSVLERYPHISACVDIGHFARSRVDPAKAIRAIGRRSVAVHVKDVDAKGGNTVVGEGTIDEPGVFAALKDSGFDGLVVLEYEGDFDNMQARMAGMRKSLDAMRRLIAGAR